MNQKLQNQISHSFLRIKTIDDIIELFEFIIREKNLNLNVSTNDILSTLYSKQKNYTTYIISKKRKGEFREIHAPIDVLKEIQFLLNQCLKSVFTPREAAHGFVDNRSIKTNAEKHVGKNYVLNIDLENFFPSINFGRVKAVLKIPPFNLPQEQARIIATLCCNNGILPQGASTSPIISNIVCRRLDSQFSQLAKKHKMQYTRYADDITFSCNKKIFTDQFLWKIRKIIKKEGFKVNEKKVRIQTQKERQMVTGIVVNKKLNVSPGFKRDLAFLINLCKRYGVIEAQAWLKKNYAKKHKYGGRVPKIENVIYGKLEFFKMVTGSKRLSYQKLKRKALFALKGIDTTPEKLEVYDNQIISLLKELEDSPNDSSKKEYLFFSLMKLTDIFKISGEENKYTIKANNLISEWKISNPFFKVNLSKITNPIDSISNTVLKNMRPLDNSTERRTVNPRYTTRILNLFTDTKHPFGRLLHRNNDLYYDLVLSASNCMKLLGKSKTQEGFNDRVVKEIYKGINGFISELQVKSRIDMFGHEIYEDVFDNLSSLIIGFKKAIRFGKNHDEMQISSLLLHAMSVTKNFDSKYSYINIESDIDNIFQDVFTSTPNIYNAFKQFFSGFVKHSNGIGCVKITAKKRQNKIILSIIDIKSSSNKNKTDFRRNIGKGNLQQIKTLLSGYCNFNIYDNFHNNEKGKINILPGSASIISPENDIKGFTYELVFYKPIQVLLIDDQDTEKRIKIAKKLIENNTQYKEILDVRTDFENYEMLKNYDLVCVHKSFYKNKYNDINKYCETYNMDIVRFSGGQMGVNKIKSNDFVMSDIIFYEDIEAFLKEIISKNEINYQIFRDKNTQSYEDFSKPIDSITNLIDYIQENAIPVNDLPPPIVDSIRELTREAIEIPLFNQLKSFERFLRKNAKNE